MTQENEGQPPLLALFHEIAPLVEHVRLMREFLEVCLDGTDHVPPGAREALRNDYVQLFNEQFDRHAHTLASVLAGILDEFPDVARVALARGQGPVTMTEGNRQLFLDRAPLIALFDEIRPLVENVRAIRNLVSRGDRVKDVPLDLRDALGGYVDSFNEQSGHHVYILASVLMGILDEFPAVADRLRVVGGKAEGSRMGRVGRAAEQKPRSSGDEPFLLAEALIRVLERVLVAVSQDEELAGRYLDVLTWVGEAIQEELEDYAFDLAYAMFAANDDAIVRKRVARLREDEKRSDLAVP